MFENTQEAIIDEGTFNTVQKLRKVIRRTDSTGKANPLTGLVYCADCGAKMYNRRGKAGFKRDWLGRKTDKRPPLKDEYIFIYHDIQGEKTKDYYRNEERE
ncbi:zinc ribbon domain-containing protein [Fusobacterium necrophorum]|uniref:zinc ribbon domain-containing protein n=2 Tax=Fusobacterium necrophorum TaxID=859 RepID=UPI0032B33537